MDTSKPLILAVDDNPDLLLIVRLLLGETYRIAEAKNGQEGLAKAIALHPDLILADMSMPVMDGDEMIHEIRKHPPLQSTPIIIISATINPVTRQRIFDAKPNQIIWKPFSPSELQNALDKWLPEKSPAAP